MAFVIDPLDQLYIVFSIQSDQEKCGRNVFRLQDVQNLWSICGVRAVIKGQHDSLVRLAESSDDVRRRIVHIGFRGDEFFLRIKPDIDLSRIR